MIDSDICVCHDKFEVHAHYRPGTECVVIGCDCEAFVHDKQHDEQSQHAEPPLRDTLQNHHHAIAARNAQAFKPVRSPNALHR